MESLFIGLCENPVMFENDLILIFSWNIHIFTIMIGTSYVSNWCCQLWEKAVVSETVAHEISDEGTFCYNNLQKKIGYSPVFNIHYGCTCNWIHSTIAVFHILSYNPLHLRCESTKFVIKIGFPIQISENLSNASISWMRQFLVFTCSRDSECLAPVRARVWQTKAWKDSGAEQFTSKQG